VLPKRLSVAIAFPISFLLTFWAQKYAAAAPPPAYSGRKGTTILPNAQFYRRTEEVMINGALIINH
ncbi:MAG: hypothetical protein LBT94_01540, partial [Prevotellaceae bacterium]|nr:hypothetical protein [Prevotellaceae bacterium]